MSRQDDIAAKAIRKTTLRCIKEKEEMLLATISKSELNDAKKTWKFGTISNSFVR